MEAFHGTPKKFINQRPGGGLRTHIQKHVQTSLNRSCGFTLFHARDYTNRIVKMQKRPNYRAFLCRTIPCGIA